MSIEDAVRWRLQRHPFAIPGLLTLGYLGLRGLNMVELWAASSAQAATGPANPEGRPSEYFVHSPAPAAPGLAGVLANWDGQWYERIATEGYPTAAESHSANDAWTWAFPPFFPLMARLVMALTGLGFPVAAVVLNLALGMVATLLLYGLLRPHVGTLVALASALAVNTFMTAPLFTAAYSEPAALVFLLLALCATVTRRYSLALIAVLLLAFTRPIAAPFALVFVAHAAARWRDRRHEPFPRVAQLLLVACTVVSLVSPLLWNAVAARLFDAAQPLAGRSESAGVSRTASMLGTFEFGWFGGVGRIAGVAGVLLFVAGFTLAVGAAEAAGRRFQLPMELRVWGAAYVVFVVAVTPVTPGLLRYLLLAAPLLVAVQVLPLTWKARRAGLVALCTITAVALWSQWWWIRYLYILDPAPALLPWPP